MQKEQQLTANKYKKICIQNLQERQQIMGKDLDRQRLVYQMNWKFNWGSKKVVCYHDSGISEERIQASRDSVSRLSPFFQAFLTAYRQHGDILLVPDQIWIMISFYLSTYIDENAEKLRSKLVKHENVKNLTIVQLAQSPQESLLMQKNWGTFFEQVIKSIQKNTHKNIVQSLKCDFSTTNQTYKVISTAIIMNSLKKFFNYTRRFCVCGINNVYMAGVRDDWAKMIPKLDNLIQFDVDGELKKYIEHMKVILENFLLTFDEKPNINWWNTIMLSYQRKQVYGGKKTEVDGWILHFFGKYGLQKMFSFPQMTIKVPIKLENYITKKQKQLLLVSDWCSISKLNNRTYKPDVGLCIFELNQTDLSRQGKFDVDSV